MPRTSKPDPWLPWPDDVSKLRDIYPDLDTLYNVVYRERWMSPDNFAWKRTHPTNHYTASVQLKHKQRQGITCYIAPATEALPTSYEPEPTPTPA